MGNVLLLPWEYLDVLPPIKRAACLSQLVYSVDQAISVVSALYRRREAPFLQQTGTWWDLQKGNTVLTEARGTKSVLTHREADVKPEGPEQVVSAVEVASS